MSESKTKHAHGIVIVSADRRSWDSQGRDNLPDSLRNAQSPYREFDMAAGGELRKKEWEAMARTEAEGRRAGEGSHQVKADKPFPELKPKDHKTQIRESFNKNWLAEQRRAQLAQYQAQEQSRANDNGHDHTHERPKRELER